uniref:LRRNT domain-containing protein n=1 Tax=Branchiostoma floridae TaxID=7739 RepID=C3YQH9_BRAFL|eukprot:XP_002601323.1 hypothetical protein BRAFLDRAFT_82778 [Branchiostoma floridae]
MAVSYRTVAFIFVLFCVLNSPTNQAVEGNYCKTCSCTPTWVLCSGKNLETIPKTVPPKARSIFLENNDISVIRAGSFRGAYSVKLLNLSKNDIADIEAEAFDGLKKAKYLYLSTNRLPYIEDHFFIGLSSVMSIFLQNNRIQYVSSSAFSTLGSLKDVDLSCNQLQAVPWDAMKLPNNKHTLMTFLLNGNKIQRPTPPPYDLQALKPHLAIYLAKNPLKCDCHLAEFLDWFTTSTNGKFSVKDGELLHCDRPCELKNANMSTLTPTTLVCDDNINDSCPAPANGGYCDLENNTTSKSISQPIEGKNAGHYHSPSSEQAVAAPASNDPTTPQSKPPNPNDFLNKPATGSKEVYIFMNGLTNNYVPTKNFTLSEYSDLLIYFIIIMIASVGISYILGPKITDWFSRKFWAKDNNYEVPEQAGNPKDANARQSCHIYEDIDKARENQAEKDADQDSAFGDANDHE